MIYSENSINTWQKTIPKEWIDYNNHLTEGFYGVAFAEASDELLIHLGFTQEYRNKHGTFYTVETQIRFLKEVHEGATISTITWLLGLDEKRLHIYHHLLIKNDPEPVATQEALLVHVIHSKQKHGPEVAPIVEPILSNAKNLISTHNLSELPEHIGQGVKNLN